MAISEPVAMLVAFYGSLDRDAASAEPDHPWREVCRARPQFEGHAQPRLPGALGYYDLAVPEVMSRQVALARQHGIGAFAFVLYGAREDCARPLDRYLARAELDLPFCLTVDGASCVEGDVGAELLRCVCDPRYLRVDGKALLVVTSPDRVPRARDAIRAWREICRARGLGELLVCVWSSDETMDPRPLGYDASLLSPGSDAAAPVLSRHACLNPGYAGEVIDWRSRAQAATLWGAQAYPRYAVVDAGHDDEPRRPGRGRVLRHASPRGYGDWLRRSIVASARQVPSQRPLVFIDSWNDWSRGAVLEPDARLGYAYLAATREALLRAGDELAGRPTARNPRPCAVVHVYHVELLDELATALRGAQLDWRLIVTTPPDRERIVRDRLIALGLVAEVEPHENRGRDILPFLRVANRLLDEGVEVVLKLHTKHSGHRANGDAWRGELIGRLLDPARAATLWQAFARDPQLGCVAPEGHLLPLSVYWGWNEDNVRALCTRMGIGGADLAHDRFVAGSMFWVRLEALRPLLDAHLGEWEFEPETGHVDGTMAHAIERALTLAVVGAGYRCETAAALLGLRFDETGYAYAQPSAPGASPLGDRSEEGPRPVPAAQVGTDSPGPELTVLLERVPRGARVLDVGCASGYLPTPLRQLRDCAFVDRVETNLDEVRGARMVYRQVVGGSTEDPATYAQLAGPYDAVVFGDRLGQLRDPAATLRAALPVLSDRGVLIASMANIAHYSIRASLFQGRFDYAESGILDRAHLRFFTRETLLALFHDNGYEVERCDAALQLPDRMRGWLGDRLAERVARLRQQVFAVQYIIVARRRPRSVARTVLGEGPGELRSTGEGLATAPLVET